MRRRSLVGPAVLILLGAAFLINNVRPELNLFSFVAEYWPFLLIAMGVLRLLEVLAYAASSRPVATKGLSGGEIFLMILVVVIGTGMFEARNHIGPMHIGSHVYEMFGESYDYPVIQRKPIGEKSRVVFDIVRGNIRVTASDEPEIKITGRKTIRAYNKADADKIDGQTPVEIVTEGDRVVVRTNQARISDDRRLTSDLEVTLPRGVSIEGRGRYGDFDITGVDGAVAITSDSAGVRLSKLGGSVRVDVKQSDLIRAVDVAGTVEVTGRGNDVELENIQGPASVNGSFGGNLEFKNLAKTFHFVSRNTDLRVERVPGRISMDLARMTGVDLVGPITLTAKSKDIKIEEFTQGLQLDLERGDVELRPHNLPVSTMDVRCRNVGNIDLILPGGAKFELSATTDKGEAGNDYGPSVVQSGGDGRSARLRSATEGGPMIHVTTARGAVKVRKE